MKTILLAVLISNAAMAQEPVLSWVDFHEPVYPQMARIAHIEGEAKMEIELGPDGTVVALRPLSGHKILVLAVKESIEKSKPVCENCYGKNAVFSVSYHFKIKETLRWAEFHPPLYPQMAKLAHIQGEVEMEIELGSDGMIVALRPVSGYAILAQAAKESIEKSKLICEHCNEKNGIFVVAYEFKFPDSSSKVRCVEPREGKDPAVLDSNSHVTITANPLCVRVDNVDPARKVHSKRCLYLWRCASR